MIYFFQISPPPGRKFLAGNVGVEFYVLPEERRKENKQDDLNVNKTKEENKQASKQRKNARE